MFANEISSVALGEKPVTITEFVAVARYHARVEFTESYVDIVRASRALIERFLAENRLIYGVTTGFGDNFTEVIAPGDAAELQANIVRSHAVSVGEPLSGEVVRAIWLMELIGLGKGYSGTGPDTLELIRTLLNADVIPYVPGEGSVGYLGPEAHMALLLIGEGRAWLGGELLDGAEVLRRVGARPIRFGCKEGLSLTNGTHSVTAIGVLAAHDASLAGQTADIAAGLSLQALKGTVRALDPRLHAVKRHPEQAGVAANLRRITENSPLSEEFLDYRLQDTYSLRGIPQMHGGAKRALNQAWTVVEEELDSVGDNPIIVPEDGDGIALMGANFDSTYVGIQSDAMANALTVLAKIAERRTDRMVNSNFSELPAFLAPNPGLHNGFMIAQYTSAALSMDLQGMAGPASARTVPTSANQEDPVSNAYSAALTAYRAAGKLGYILAIELLCAAQAFDLLAPRRPSPVSEAVKELIRSAAPEVTGDRAFHGDIEAIREFVRHGKVLRTVEARTGPLEC